MVIAVASSSLSAARARRCDNISFDSLHAAGDLGTCARLRQARVAPSAMPTPRSSIAVPLPPAASS